MAYQGLVTTLHNYRKDPNSNNLWLADCFCEGVVVGPNMKEGELVLYLPTDGKIERWFGDPLNLFRKNKDGTLQGGYIEDSQHIRAIKLRGNESSGVVVSLAKINELFGFQNWKDGDTVTEINGKEFVSKYIPKKKNYKMTTVKKSYKGKKAEGITYPEFSMHKETGQLAYNLNDFKLGDIINLSLKMHGTSSRHMKTYGELPRGFFRKLFHLPAKRKEAYVCGTRRCIVSENSKGYYGNDEFRLKHHKEIEPYIEEGMCIYGEIVGYYGPNETDTIMPIGDNTKINDKQFVKEFGKYSVFNYGCKPGESKLYIYRITTNNGEKEWNPDEISKWCEDRGLLHVPYIDTFEFTDTEDLLKRVNSYLEDLHDPIGISHIKEGVVIRILNRPLGWKAYKSKSYEFRVIEGIIKESAEVPDMEEAQEEILVNIE